MHLSDFLCSASILADMTARTKDDAIIELAGAAVAAGLDKDKVHNVLLDRESLGSTAVGNGYAIPHGKMPGLESIILIFARSVAGIDFNAPDSKACHFFFVVLAPEGAAGQHLGLLGSIARLAKDATFKNRLLQAKNTEELTAFLMAA